LAALATNPMLLSLITLLHYVRLRLPENRPILYRDCIELLLDRWELYKGLQREEAFRITPIQKTSILASIAWSMHDDRLKEIPRSVLENYLTANLQQFIKDVSPDAAAVLVELLEQCGLFLTKETSVSGDNIYSFSHLSFQEYLVSSKLRLMPVA